MKTDVVVFAEGGRWHVGRLNTVRDEWVRETVLGYRNRRRAELRAQRVRRTWDRIERQRAETVAWRAAEDAAIQQHTRGATDR